jgi:hypothetical protein
MRDRFYEGALAGPVAAKGYTPVWGATRSLVRG